MQRDFELIWAILNAVETATDGVQLIDLPNGIAKFREVLGEEHSSAAESVLLYHIKMLVDEGILYGHAGDKRYKHSSTEIQRYCAPKQATIYGLTWQGHEFLANARTDSAWEKIKPGIKTMSWSIIVQTVAVMAADAAKRLISG